MDLRFTPSPGPAQLAEPNDCDEIKRFLQARFLSSEAFWHLYGFDMHAVAPTWPACKCTCPARTWCTSPKICSCNAWRKPTSISELPPRTRLTLALAASHRRYPIPVLRRRGRPLRLGGDRQALDSQTAGPRGQSSSGLAGDRQALDSQAARPRCRCPQPGLPHAGCTPPA